MEEKAEAQKNYQVRVAELEKEHQQTLSKLTDQGEIKDENYVHKNRLFDAKMQLEKDIQAAKDRQHAAFQHRYHMIDMLRMSKFTFSENMAQKVENYKYTFNKRDFLLKNGLYIAIVIIFIALCAITPAVKGVQLLTLNNVLNILQQASPRMFLALGVAGLILLGRYGPVHRPYGWYGHGNRHHYHASGNQYRFRIRAYLRFYGTSHSGQSDSGAGDVHYLYHLLYHHRRLLYGTV